MRDTTKFFLTSAEQIPWLSHVGGALSRPGIRVVSDSQEAVKLLASPESDSVRLMLKNRLAALVNIRHYARFSKWNELSREVKAVMAARISPVVVTALAKDGLPASANDSIAWDLLLIALEAEYSDVVAKSEVTELLWPWYSAGHVPCGWDNLVLDTAWAEQGLPLPQTDLVIY
jgi:hypothetical protein